MNLFDFAMIITIQARGVSCGQIIKDFSSLLVPANTLFADEEVNARNPEQEVRPKKMKLRLKIPLMLRVMSLWKMLIKIF